VRGGNSGRSAVLADGTNARDKLFCRRSGGCPIAVTVNNRRIQPCTEVPIDGSETSSRGLNEAIKIARVQGSQLRLVHIVNEFVLDCPYAPGLYAENLIETLIKGGRAVLDAAEKAAQREGVKADTVLIESIGGVAADLILAQATQWPADLIVMGTHGRRGIARLAMGSDAEQVVRTATVPVMLVRCTEKHGKVRPEVTSGEATAA
jgi:nucleotide-binding universal stress UspA family protein